MATDRQIAFITSLVSQSSYPSVIDAINAYGLDLRTARDLSVTEASEMIDFLTGKPHRASIAPAVKSGKGARVGLKGFVSSSGAQIEVVADKGKNLKVFFPATGATILFPAEMITLNA